MTKLEEIMEEVIPVFNGITDELESYELTKEQYEWFLVEASKKEELEERFETLSDIHDRTVEENQRYKQALEFYADEEHYKEKLISEAQYDADGICISNDEYAPPIIYFDSGEKARQALEDEE
ncbi:hypothetical protein [Ornithinibacillus sp. JPR2-1]|uniref:hypothetical protein n=1 Tax=Ornithinibacillus sp. JPR2-1 TaxID=2094019 RepID=UPI0031D5291B